MHRTAGDGYKDEAGYHRFEDQALPTIPGTVDTAEYNNAVQEELCNVIEGVGLTLNGGGQNGTPAADRAAGWSQLYEAIFQSEHITDAAIDELSFSKLTGVINIVDGSKQWYQSTSSWYLSDGNEQVFINAGKIAVSETGVGKAELHADESIFENDINTRISGKGIRYSDGPGNVAGFKTAKIRKSAFQITGATWVSIGSSGVYVDTGDITTDIPISVPLTGIYSAWVLSDNGTTTQLCPAAINIREVGGSGFYTVIETHVLTPDLTSPESSYILVIEYDGSTVT